MHLQQSELNVLQAIVARGLADSSHSLSSMTTGQIQLQAPQVAFLPLSRVPEVAGGAATVVVAVYLGMEGDLKGHLMLIFSEEAAAGLVDLLLDQPVGTTTELDEMAISALAEAGNICGSAFMNAIADETGLVITPTPPLVVRDMAGAILEAVVAELFLSGDEALVVETGFNGKVPGHFLLMPNTESMARLVAALEAIR